MSVLYIILFTSFDRYTCILTDVYHISQGLTYILLVPMFVGILSVAPLVLVIYRYTKALVLPNEAKGLGQDIDPEARLLFAMASSALAIRISLFWMAWTSYSSISIWCPSLSSVIFGYGIITTLLSSYMYIIDMYGVYAASALTLATLTRYMCGGGMMVVGIPLYQDVGYHLTLTILACISVPLRAVPYVFYHFRPAVRRRSRPAANTEVASPEKETNGDSE